MFRSKAIIPLSLVAGFLFQGTAFASFPDVPASHPNYKAILYVQEHGIVSGYPDGTYKPDNTINRAEFVKILVHAKADESAIRACYDEVEPAHWAFVERMHDAWYAPYVCYAKKFHLIDGYPDGTFRPTNNINFVEAAKIITKAFNLSVTDDSSIWYKGYVDALAAKNAIPSTIFSFDTKLTRGEMAEIIYRLSAHIENKQSATYQELAIKKNDSWKTFNSKFFHLSFKVPQGFSIEESQNIIQIAAPQPPPEAYATIYYFLDISRYTGAETITTEIEDARESLKNIVEDSVVIDGNSFVRISGNVFSTIDGKIEIIPGKIEYIFFEKSKVLIFSGFPELVSGYDSLILGNQIILTMKFSSTER